MEACCCKPTADEVNSSGRFLGLVIGGPLLSGRACFYQFIGCQFLWLITSFVAAEITQTKTTYPPDQDTPAGVCAALSSVVDVGETVAIEGPPSDLRDSDRAENSADLVKKWMDPLRDDPNGTYQKLVKNYLTTLHTDVSLAQFSQKVHQRYDELILHHVPAPKLTKIESEHLTLVYPAGYYQNQQVVRVPTRRITVHAVDRFGDRRHVVAYFANYDKVDPRNPSVVFQVNGHFGHNPTRIGLGIEKRGGYSGAALGKLVLQGLPLIAFDDHDVGESSDATGKENGQYRTLANLRMMDDALLVHFARVDAIGISGGCERLYHFMMFHRCPMATAYLAGFFRPPWLDFYHWKTTAGERGVDHDTFNEVFYANFQWTDLVLVGIQRCIDIRLASMTYEGGSGKYSLRHEMLPAIRHYTDRFTVGGDDPDCDGISNNGRNLSHEYDLIDYREYLARTRK